MNDRQQGPFTLEQLGGMSIMPDTPVWHDGMPDWAPASAVAELQHMVAYAPGAASAPAPEQGEPQGARPPQWNGARQQVDPQPAEAEPVPVKPRKSHTALWVTLIVIAVLAILLAVTNPTKDDHCRAITSVSRSWMSQTIEEMGGSGVIGGLLKVGSTQLIRGVVNQVVEVDNYVLFSLGYIDTGAEKSRISLGIMGHVFTFDKNQINEKLQEAIGISVKDALNIGRGMLGTEPDVEEDNSIVEPSPEPQEPQVPEEDVVTPEDRAESSFDLPAEVDTLIKESAKIATKQGAKMLERAIDKAFK